MPYLAVTDMLVQASHIKVCVSVWKAFTETVM